MRLGQQTQCLAICHSWDIPGHVITLNRSKTGYDILMKEKSANLRTCPHRMQVKQSRTKAFLQLENSQLSCKERACQVRKGPSRWQV